MAPIRAFGATTILCLLLIAQAINAAQFVSPSGELLKLLVRSSTGEVMVSTNTTLYTLSDELSLQQNVSYEGHFRMLAQSNVGHFMWCDSIRCNLTIPSNTLISFPANVREILDEDMRQHARTFLRADTTVLSATIIPQSNQNVVYVLKNEIHDNSRIYLNIGKITINTSSFLLAGSHDEDFYTGFSRREIVSTIKSDEYFYYIINQVTDDRLTVKLVRICVNDTGISELNAFGYVRAFNSYYELELQCDDSNRASSAAYYSGDGGPHIIVSFGGVTCAYKESVISSMITNKFTECSQGVGMSGLIITEQQAQCLSSGGALSECQIGDGNSYALEVDTTYRGRVILSTSSRIVSMFSFDNFGSVAVLGASDDNHVHKYSVSTNSTALLSLRESFNLSVGPVKSLAASPNGTLLYVLTPNKVMSYSSEQCGQYSNCDQCLDQVDPVCGWCLLYNKCSTQQSCPSQLWITSDRVSSTEQCPRGNIADDMISTEETPYDVTVRVSNLPMIDPECTFTMGGVVTALPTQVSQGRNTVTCTLTAPISLFTNNDTIVLRLSLRARDSGQTFLNTTGTITVSDCTKYRRCGSCLSSSHCTWCPHSAKCTALSCSPAVANVNSCPQLVTPTGPYTLHLNVNEQLVISGTNFIQSGNHYYCVVTYGEVSLSVTASWDSVQKSITCGQRNYNFANTAGVSTASADLQVIWNTPDNVNYTIEEPMDDVRVTLYQCGLLGTDCTSCLAQKTTNFDCVFCSTPTGLQTGCMFDDRCRAPDRSLDTCPSPRIHQFNPEAGPINGGTVISIDGSNLGMRFGDIKSIKIGTAYCSPNESSYVVGRRINCITEVMNGPHSSNITIVTDNGNHTSTEQFYYKEVRVDQVLPQTGPLSGGTTLNITGENLDIGNTQTVLVQGKQCVILEIISEHITCRTPSGDYDNKTAESTVIVLVDGFRETQRFRYVNDPIYSNIIPKYSFTSGGTTFRVSGERLDVVQSPEILFTISSRKRQTSLELRGPCNAMNSTLLSCDAPELPKDVYGSTDQQVTLGLVMDGVTELLTLNVTISVFTDPVFYPLTTDNSSLVYNEGVYDVINITGRNFRFNQDQLLVRISNISTCRVIQTTSSNVECIPVDADYPVDVDLSITVELGNQRTAVGNIRFEDEETSIIVVVVAVIVSVFVLILLALVFIIILGCVWRNSRRKDQKLDELQMTLNKLETNVAHECKEAFTQLLTDLDEYTGDLTNVNLPYFDFKNYMLKTVVSGLEETQLSSKLRNNQLPQLHERLGEFHHLMMDRRFLLMVIKTMEEQRDFSIREKCLMGNLLTVILHTRMDYLTQIMKMSLSDLIRKSVARDNYRVLLRRTDSVAERILSNWLALCLHQHILDQVGQPLYTLYRAIKGQLEKGPVDVVTGDARYSLSEQRIIRQQMAEVPEIIVSVFAEESNIRANVKLLQCDTISQAKEKIFDHIYRSLPVSSRPYTFHNSDIYLIQASGRITVLRDFDYTTEEDGEWKKVNTLEHYEIHKEKSPCFRLVRRSSYSSGVSDYPATLVTTPNAQLKPHANEEGQKYWHLFKHVDHDDPKVSPLLSKKLVTEVFFPRILYTKKVLQSFVDDLFNALFSIDHVPSTPYANGNHRQFLFNNGNLPSPTNNNRGFGSVPVAVKYLFDYLDSEAYNAGVADHDVVHVWKNNSLSLRFWVNLIKNPEFVFDVNKSLTMDACLSIVAQAFIDGCSLSEVKLNKDSPTGKLLYNKDVMGYKQKVRRYYDDIKRLQPISEGAMISYLKGLSSYQVQMMGNDYPFSIHSALYQLLRLTARHSHKILENLREKGLDNPAMRYETILHEILTEV